MCMDRDGRLVAARVADHIDPHRGDPVKFWTGELQALCDDCHNGDKKRIEAGGKAKARIGADGWPIP